MDETEVRKAEGLSPDGLRSQHAELLPDRLEMHRGRWDHRKKHHKGGLFDLLGYVFPRWWW
jgi:hypothetical protein